MVVWVPHVRVGHRQNLNTNLSREIYWGFFMPDIFKYENLLQNVVVLPYSKNVDTVLIIH